MGYWNDLLSGKVSLRKKISEDIGEILSFLISETNKADNLFREINDFDTAYERVDNTNKYILGYLFSIAMQLYDSLESGQTSSTYEGRDADKKLFTVTCAFSIALNMNRLTIENYFEHIITSNNDNFYSGMRDFQQSLSIDLYTGDKLKKMISTELRLKLKSKGYV